MTGIHKEDIRLLDETTKENICLTDEGSLAPSVFSSLLMPLCLGRECGDELGVTSKMMIKESVNWKKR